MISALKTVFLIRIYELSGIQPFTDNNCQQVGSMSVRYTNENDNGGQRSWLDRRQFEYDAYFPERRKKPERRFEKDRRILAQQFRDRKLPGSRDSRRSKVIPGLNDRR